LAVGVEGIKLDNVVLESRMEHKTITNTEIINNVQQELLKLQSKCDMLADRVGNIENTNDERDSDIFGTPK
jgi:regulator of RNase E activity RraB